MKFEADRSKSSNYVWVEDERGRRLLPHVCRHSPGGFEWGYLGSGPADLALSICSYLLGSIAEAEKVYQGFKAKCVSGLPKDKWVLHEEYARQILVEVELAQKASKNAKA